MADTNTIDIPIADDGRDNEENLYSMKVGLAKIMLQGKGGVIVEVTNAEQAKIAEEAGACCIVIHNAEHMPQLSVVAQIKRTVSIPVMVRIRLGHFVEASILEQLGVDFIDESELVSNPANTTNYIKKNIFRLPFACGCTNFEQALARIHEGAAIIWIQGSGLDVTVENMMSIVQTTKELAESDEEHIFNTFVKEMETSYDLLAEIKEMGKLPVVLIALGGIKTPADAALMMHLGCDGVCVKWEIFESSETFFSTNLINPSKRVRAIVEAVKHYDNPRVLVECSNWFDGNTMEGDEDLT